MTILNPFYQPTAGIPQPTMFNMTNPNFYTQQQYNQQQQQQQNPVITNPNAAQPQYDQQQITQDNLMQQLQRIRGKAALPELQPGSRVQNPNMALVDPSGFQTYYDSLNTLGQESQRAVTDAQITANVKHQQELARIAAQTPPPFSGVTLQGNYSNQSNGATDAGNSPHSGYPVGNLPPHGNNDYNRGVVQRMAAERGWTGGEWDALYRLVMKESGFDAGAANPNSDARGMFQKMINMHGPIESTPEGQTQWGLDYIARRYGTPSAALQWHLAHNWY